MTFFDAHNHLQHERLAPHLPEVLRQLEAQALGTAVVNGTREADWDGVSDLAEQHRWIIPSYGLHPWCVADRSEKWQQRLEEFIAKDPRAAVGEVGLDRWIQGYDLDLQRSVFLAQLELAKKYERPITVHCVRAWGALWEVLRTSPLPSRGFLLHAYSGPMEMVSAFIDRGAYFSFSPYFLHERKAPQRDVFRQLPPDRLLVETDAPDLAPPLEENPRPLTDASGVIINHPANIDLTYRALAKLRGVEVSALAAQVGENFSRLFGAT